MGRRMRSVWKKPPVWHCHGLSYGRDPPPGLSFPNQTNEDRICAVVRCFVGCSRFVWNELLALNELRRERGEKRLNYNAMAGYLVYLKNEHPFLREVHSQPLQQTLKDLALAYQRAFDPKLAARFPRFKKRGRQQSIRFPQGFAIDGSAVYLPKIGWIGFRKSRKIEGTPKNITVSVDGEHWYITIQTEREAGEPVHASDSAVGVDLGIVRFAALSDGSLSKARTPSRNTRSALRFISVGWRVR